MTRMSVVTQLRHGILENQWCLAGFNKRLSRRPLFVDRAKAWACLDRSTEDGISQGRSSESRGRSLASDLCMNEFAIRRRAIAIIANL